jgi:hypothetical protein
MFLAVAALTGIAATSNAQSWERRAVLKGGYSDRGKCTIEVVVDGAAEVEVRGDRAILRNVWGQPPQWRRFECNSVMPPNPAEFRFAGVDGRGRQDLIADPRNGGPAVVRIEDKDGGSEGYTFDLFWNNRPGFPSGPILPPPPGRRFTVEQAVRVCQDAVRDQARDRFRTRDIDFRRAALDDNPGRRDWVVGTFVVQRGPGRGEYRFSCSVDFDSGRVRSAEIEQPGGGYGRRDGGRAIEGCRRAVEDRVRRDGYDRIDFEAINVDNNPGRNDWVIGSIRAEGRFGRPERFNFSCRVNLDNGEVRSVDVVRR